jgi:hypothetical protein
MKLTDRISLLEICDRLFPFGIAVEVGVAGGHFSQQILATWESIGQLHLIDPWKHFDEGYEDYCNLSQQVQDERFERIKIDFGSNDKVNILRYASPDAAKYFPHESVHFVYLDANHSTKAVLADLEAWWQKIIPGGILAGHDYQPGDGKGYGVKAAVDQFASELNIPIHQTTQEFCRKSGVYGDGWEGFSFVFRKE